MRAVKGASLTLVPGELTLLMGPSGSGKTTLLSILGCILTPTSGTLRIAGVSTDKLNAEELAHLRRKHMGFIFQSYNLFPTLTALENVRISLDVRGQKGFAAANRSEEVLRDVGLAYRLKSYPGNLSAVSSSASPLPAPSLPRRRSCWPTSRRPLSTARTDTR